LLTSRSAAEWRPQDRRRGLGFGGAGVGDETEAARSRFDFYRSLEEGEDESDWRLPEAVAAPASMTDSVGRVELGCVRTFSWAASVLGS